jgi:hypothetical protein
MTLAPALEKLVNQLKTGDDAQRQAAARELGLCGTPECIPFLEKALNDSHFGVQAGSENAITRIKARAAEEAREAEIAAKKAAQEARLRAEAQAAEEARRLEEEERRKKEIRIEELLSEEEIQRIKLEEIKKIELAKQQKTEELKKLEKQKLKEEEKRLLEEKRLEEEKRKKAEALLREKIRAEAAEQKGLVEYEGEWVTPEELKVREYEALEAEKKKENAFKRLKARRRKENQFKIDSLAGQKEDGLIFLFNSSAGALGGGILLLALGFSLYKPLLSISAILLIITIVIMLGILWMIYDTEKSIYTYRIYEVEDKTFVIKMKMRSHWLLLLMQKAVFRVNPELRAYFDKPASDKAASDKALSENSENTSETPEPEKKKNK